MRYGGLIHDYGLLNALSQIPAVRAALLIFRGFVRIPVTKGLLQALIEHLRARLQHQMCTFLRPLLKAIGKREDSSGDRNARHLPGPGTVSRCVQSFCGRADLL